MPPWPRSRIGPPGRGSGCDAMIFKVITLFLLAMAVLAIVGKALFPGTGRARRARKCRACGRPIIGKGPCPCQARN